MFAVGLCMFCQNKILRGTSFIEKQNFKYMKIEGKYLSKTVDIVIQRRKFNAKNRIMTPFIQLLQCIQ